MSAEEVKIGPFQVILIFLLGINYVIVSMNHALSDFHSFTPEFHCTAQDHDNFTQGCLTPGPEVVTSSNWSTSDIESNIRYSSCETGYRFKSNRGETSIVTEWGLICERRYLLRLSTTLYFDGVVIGAWIAGIIADRVGRLPVLAMCLYTQGTLAVALYIIQDYRAFLVVRALQGVFVQGLQISTYMLLLELFPARIRALVAMTLEIGWAMGLALLAGLSYAIGDWRVLQLAISVPTAVTVLYIWIIPESPRWLLAKGKLTEAHMALENINKYNACCGTKIQQSEENVDEEANATTITETVTPVKPKRKSRISNVDLNETRSSEPSNHEEQDTTNQEPSDEKNAEEYLLLTPSESMEQKISRLESQLKFVTRSESDQKIESSKPLSGFKTDKDSRPNSISDSDSNQQIVPETSNKIVELKSAEAIQELRKNSEEELDREKDQVKQDIEKKVDVASNQTFIRLLREPELRRCCLILILVWFSISLCQCGFVYHQPDLTYDRHVNFAIGATLDLIVYGLTYILLLRFGRRYPLSFYLLLSAVLCIVIAVLNIPVLKTASWNERTRSILILIGKAAIVGSSAIIYLYTVEIFPTILRGAGLGYCGISGKIGNLIAPYVLLLGVSVWVVVPIAMMGILCVTSGIACLLLPDTLDKPLPDTIEQAKELCRKSGSDSQIDSVSPKTVINNRRNTVVDENGQDVLREKLFSDENDGETWVDVGNGIIVNFPEKKNVE